MAGHSKWANIKHRKARQDAKRGQAWSKCARAIIAAAKNGGGDPSANLTLRYAIDEARTVNMPKDTIENAIKKGTGELAGANYENVVYEGYGANGVAILLELLTDNRNRTAGEIRKIFEKSGGHLGTAGCVAYLFANKGSVVVVKDAADEEAMVAAAIDAGAEDIIDDGESWHIVTEPTHFVAVRDALQQASVPIQSARMTMIPNGTVACEGKEARNLLHLIEALEDHDDVQTVFANFDIPEEEWVALGEVD